DARELGDSREVLLSYGLWQRRFAGDPDLLGKPLRLDGETYTVAGVMPREFRFATFWVTGAELWAPLPLAARAADRDGSSLRVFARLAPGVSLLVVRAALGAGRTRLVRQLLAESLLLAALGGAAGVGLAALGFELLSTRLPD